MDVFGQISLKILGQLEKKLNL